MKYAIFVLTVFLFISCNVSDPEVDQVMERDVTLQKSKKVMILHKTSQENYITIEISESAMDAHLAHGDIPVVKIGEQYWTAKNLNVGTMINGSNDQADNGIVEKYCYGNDEANCDEYGGLYQWNEAMQYVTEEGAQGICPTGWHIPTFAEFKILNDAVAGDGNALKAIGQGVGAGAGTNTSGFLALLAGRRRANGYFGYLGSTIHFRSSTEYNAVEARYMRLNGTNNTILLFETDKRAGFSIRCLKD